MMPMSMVPISLPMPFFSQGQIPSKDEPPARVKVAMEWIQQCAIKTADRIAVNEMNMESFTGQKLTKAEEEAHARACLMLRDYFHGMMEPNIWEKQLLVEKETANLSPHNKAGVTIVCFICASLPTPRQSCLFCRGTGQLVVYSVGKDETTGTCVSGGIENAAE